MKATVHIDDFPRAERKEILRNRCHGATNVFGRPPSFDWRQSILDQLVVFPLHRTGHVGGNDPGAQFKHADAMLALTEVTKEMER